MWTLESVNKVVRAQTHSLSRCLSLCIREIQIKADWQIKRAAFFEHEEIETVCEQKGEEMDNGKRASDTDSENKVL